MNRSIEPFRKLVKLTARAFYDDDITKTENQPKNNRSDNQGIAVVVLDALTRRAWVRDEDLAKDLKLNLRQLRRILQFFKNEKLVTCEHRKETAKGVKMHNAAIAATVDGWQTGKEGDDKIKLHTHSYCCLDYQQIHDVIRYKLHRMKKILKDKLDDKNTVPEYICPNCGKRYNALDALQLISMKDEYFHCERCNGVLVQESDKLAVEEVGDGDDNGKRRQRENTNDQLRRMELQLKPLQDQLNRVKDLTFPEYASLQEWEACASAAALAENSRSSHMPWNGGSRMLLFGETKVEVALAGADVKDEEEDVKPENAAAGQMKVLPPWMIKEGMKLTKEERGGNDVKQESKVDGSSAQADYSDDKKSAAAENDDKNDVEVDEQLRGFYEAMVKSQEQKSAANTQESVVGLSNRQVGMKAKREHEEENDFEWEENDVEWY